MLGAADDSSLIEPFAKAFDLEIRSKANILADPDVHAVVRSRATGWPISRSRRSKRARLSWLAGRNSADTKRIVDAIEENQGAAQVGPGARPRSRCHAGRAAGWEAGQGAASKGARRLLAQRGAHQPPQPARTSMARCSSSGCHLFDRIIHHFGMPAFGQCADNQVRQHGGEFREDAAGAVLNYADKIVVVDFFSWDRCWLESWDMRPTAPRGSCTRPLPASYKIYDRGNAGALEGWTEWHETSFPINWASRKTEYSPELAEIGNPFRP